ncbi:hypothetical protein C8J57DRAFT_1242271 [Mycena rebaudengoi]|nr:hypothetical protein C8J57DRAFT_1242271 [Mycena rebaudengoi]
MPPPTRLAEASAKAHQWCTICQTNPKMSVYQPIAVSALEICAVSTDTKLMKLALYAVDETALNSLLFWRPTKGFWMTSARHIENAQISKNKPGNLFSRHISSSRVKKELKKQLKIVLHDGQPAPPTRGENPVEILSVSLRASTAICKTPPLNFLKPIIGIAALICGTAKGIQRRSGQGVEFIHAGRSDIQSQAARWRGVAEFRGTASTTGELRWFGENSLGCRGGACRYVLILKLQTGSWLGHGIYNYPTSMGMVLGFAGHVGSRGFRCRSPTSVFSALRFFGPHNTAVSQMYLFSTYFPSEALDRFRLIGGGTPLLFRFLTVLGKKLRRLMNKGFIFGAEPATIDVVSC